MDCKTARRLMDVCRLSEHDWQAPELSGVAEHLEECSDCLTRFRGRQAFDERVARTMRSVSVPAGLNDRILARLDRAEVWRRRRVIATWSAAAAAVMLAVGLAVWPHSRPSPADLAADPKQLGESAVAAVDGHDEDDEIALPDAPAGGHDVQSIETWLARSSRRLRVTGSLPLKLPASALQSIWRGTVSDRRVAVFHYEDPRGGADVFVFPHSQFNVGSVSQARQPIHGTRNLVVVAWTEQDTTYVAVLRNWSPQDTRQFVGRPGGMT